MTDEERAEWIAKGTPVHVATSGSVAKTGEFMVRGWAEWERIAAKLLDKSGVDHPHGFYVHEVILRPRAEEGVSK